MCNVLWLRGAILITIPQFATSVAGLDGLTFSLQLLKSPLMRKAILILVCLLLLPLGVISQRKRPAKSKPKRDPDLEAGLVKTSPCGVPIPSFDDFVEELKVEWRVGVEVKDGTTYYNTQKIICENGILKAWIKSVKKGTPPQPYSLARYELNCTTNRLRVTSELHYSKDGDLLHSYQYDNAKWEDVAPDTAGEGTLEKLCHKKV